MHYRVHHRQVDSQEVTVTEKVGALIMAVGQFGIEVHRAAESAGGAENGTAASATSTEVVVAGTVDMATSDSLRRTLSNALDEGAVRITVDVSKVELIDAAGIGILVGAANRARDLGGSLTVLHPSRSVRRVIEAVELDGMLIGGD